MVLVCPDESQYKRLRSAGVLMLMMVAPYFLTSSRLTAVGRLLCKRRAAAAIMKSKLRSMMQSFTQTRMKDNVPHADVVVANPVHYAIALKYDENLNYDQLQEQLLGLLENPINLVDVEKKSLSQLFFLSEKQIRDILNYSGNTGFLSVYELQNRMEKAGKI